MTRGRKPAPPSLAFGDAEIDAVLLGLARVATAEDEDAALADTARAARDRIAAALPPEPPYRPRRDDPPLIRTLGAALASETRLGLRYRDGKGVASDRIVWPVLLGEAMLVAWCEARRDFRHFRLDRMVAAEALDDRIGLRRRVLLAAYMHQQREAGAW